MALLSFGKNFAPLRSKKIDYKLLRAILTKYFHAFLLLSLLTGLSSLLQYAQAQENEVLLQLLEKLYAAELSEDELKASSALMEYYKKEQAWVRTLDYAQRTALLAGKQKNIEAQGNALEVFGHAAEILRQPIKADSVLSLAQSLAARRKNTRREFSILARLVPLKSSLGKRLEAKQKAQRFLALAKSGNTTEQLKALNALAMTHKALGQPDSAQILLKEANELLAAPHTLSSEEVFTIKANLATIYLLGGQTQKGVNIFTEVAELAKRSKSIDLIAQANNFQAAAYAQANEASRAMAFIRQNIAQKDAIKGTASLMVSYQVAAKLERALGNYQQAQEYLSAYHETKGAIQRHEEATYEAHLQRGIQDTDIEQRYKNDIEARQRQLLELGRLQAESETREKDLALKQAELERLKQQQQLRDERIRTDSLSRLQIRNQLLLAEDALKAEEDQKRIAALQKQNALDELRLREQELQRTESQRVMDSLRQKERLQELQIKEQESREAYTLVGVLMLLAILGVILYAFYKNQKNKRLLAKQNTQLQDKNARIAEQHQSLTQAYAKIEETQNSITDSIRYGKRIQTALLPPDELFQAAFAEFFILYFPKDIVSGDFYWFHEADGYTFVAAVDCTGHGVPGAFMSMIGITVLNEIVDKEHIEAPDAMLAELDRRVKTSLKQTESRNRDGMELALCRILEKENDEFEVSYAGARCDLYYLEQGELKVQKASRRAIADTVRNKGEFEAHTLMLQKGDALYLLTDGLKDQANPERKKLGSRTVKQHLQEIQALPMDEQKRKTDALLMNHQSDAAQRDDITVIGIRL